MVTKRAGYNNLKKASGPLQARKRRPVSLMPRDYSPVLSPFAADYIRPEMPFASSHSRGLQLPEL